MIRSKNDESAAVTQDNGFAIARRQFDRIADRLRLDSATRDLLRSPLREHHFAIPIRMDDGTRRVFRGDVEVCDDLTSILGTVRT